MSMAIAATEIDAAVNGIVPGLIALRRRLHELTGAGEKVRAALAPGD
ncbi:MAG: hypothetical protein IT529_18655 [Burkholderiales bacterium]|nr:hypothetical protein [Burkholderiales bacterium]